MGGPGPRGRDMPAPPPPPPAPGRRASPSGHGRDFGPLLPPPQANGGDMPGRRSPPHHAREPGFGGPPAGGAWGHHPDEPQPTWKRLRMDGMPPRGDGRFGGGPGDMHGPDPMRDGMHGPGSMRDDMHGPGAREPSHGIAPKFLHGPGPMRDDGPRFGGGPRDVGPEHMGQGEGFRPKVVVPGPVPGAMRGLSGEQVGGEGLLGGRMGGAGPGGLGMGPLGGPRRMSMDGQPGMGQPVDRSQPGGAWQQQQPQQRQPQPQQRPAQLQPQPQPLQRTSEELVRAMPDIFARPQPAALGAGQLQTGGLVQAAKQRQEVRQEVPQQSLHQQRAVSQPQQQSLQPQGQLQGQGQGQQGVAQQRAGWTSQPPQQQSQPQQPQQRGGWTATSPQPQLQQSQPQPQQRGGWTAHPPQSQMQPQQQPPSAMSRQQPAAQPNLNLARAQPGPPASQTPHMLPRQQMPTNQYPNGVAMPPITGISNAGVGVLGVAGGGGVRRPDVESQVWFYTDPKGAQQGPCSVAQFRAWVKTMKSSPGLAQALAQFESAPAWSASDARRRPLRQLLAEYGAA